MKANQVLERCASTNDLAKQLGEQGAPHGTWISARVQDAGRGRLGRKWESLEGNLFLSMVARIENKALWTWVPLASAVAVVRALSPRFPQHPFSIKWPNDIWIDGAKLGGILCEAVGNRTGSFVVVGLGLNSRHAPDVDQKTTSLGVDADEIRHLIVASLASTLAELDSQGIADIVRDYDSHAAFPAGCEVEWGQGKGVVHGLGESGELIVTFDGQQTRLFAEDVRVRASQKASDGSLA